MGQLPPAAVRLSTLALSAVGEGGSFERLGES
jgi:hypothetical protein